MNKKETRYALNLICSLAENATCEDLHHKQAHQHADDEMCKAYYELSRQIHLLKEHLKAKGII